MRKYAVPRHGHWTKVGEEETVHRVPSRRGQKRFARVAVSIYTLVPRGRYTPHMGKKQLDKAAKNARRTVWLPTHIDEHGSTQGWREVVAAE